MGTANNRIVPDVFHVGYPRTGTTWIQKGVMPQLEGEIYIPKSRVSDYYYARQSSDLNGIYDDIPLEVVSGRKVFETEEVFSGGPYRDELEMAERISWVNPSAQIIVTLRSQFTLIPSLYPLYVRKGGTASFGDYINIMLENDKLDYLKLISSYRNKFGAGNVTVLFFEDMIESRSKFVSMFLKPLAINKQVEMPGNNLRNQSPPRSFVGIQRMYNKLFGLEALTREMLQEEIDILRRSLHLRARLFGPIRVLYEVVKKFVQLNSTYSLPETQLNRIKEKYAQSNKQLFELVGRPITDSGYPGDSRVEG